MLTQLFLLPKLHSLALQFSLEPSRSTCVLPMVLVVHASSGSRHSMISAKVSGSVDKIRNNILILSNDGLCSLSDIPRSTVLY